MDLFLGMLVILALLMTLYRGFRLAPHGQSEGDPNRDPTMGGAPVRPEYDSSSFSSSSGDDAGGD